MRFALFGRLYSNPQYEKSSAKHMALIIAILTLLMLFFMFRYKDYLETPTKSQLIHLQVAAYSGLIAAYLAGTDAYFRPLVPSVTLFDELSIVGGYVGLWSLLAIIFGNAVYWLLGAGISVTMTIWGLWEWFGRDQDQKAGYERDNLGQAFIQALLASETPAAEYTIISGALSAVLNRSDDEFSRSIIQAAITRMSPPVPGGEDDQP